MSTAPPILLLQALLLPFAGFIPSPVPDVYSDGQASTCFDPVSAQTCTVSYAVPAPALVRIKRLTSSPWTTIKSTLHDGSASGHGEAALGKMSPHLPFYCCRLVVLIRTDLMKDVFLLCRAHGR
ncbi:hypothetical protein HPB48_002317 [Haemaphysalis longicornis]|uniref:Secreted protein n=1 Tax=Haemaphysalis longicornis TaxID=44386 RepID=A0A9J6FVT0_HAELO|nr:hypothetical protein HPB48_002317 [Haemaphysalis longicornis]